MAYRDRVIVEVRERMADFEHGWATGDEVICWTGGAPIYRSRLGHWLKLLRDWA